jgi:hypothetical protein
MKIYWMVVLTCFNHLEKYESQWEGLSHILWKITTVPNHQPVYENAMMINADFCDQKIKTHPS